MELVPRTGNENDDPIELPPGFRFHPTDEELIIHYLYPKVLDSCFSATAITEIDLNKCEPWDLPRRAKIGEKEWYFFCVRVRKYPTGVRTNRATGAGYWKATGKDKEIYRGTEQIGMKKTLVFYKGRAPTGKKTNWVMHEFRLDSNNYCQDNHPRNEWVICRVFQKGPGGKKLEISEWASLSYHENQLPSSPLPPLMDSPAQDSETKSTVGEDDPHVTCFSDLVKDQKTKDDMMYRFDNGFLASSSTSNLSPELTSTKTKEKESFPFAQIASQNGILQYPDYSVLHNQSKPRMLLPAKVELSEQRDLRMTGMSSNIPNHEMFLECFGDQDFSLSTAAEPCDSGCLWND